MKLLERPVRMISRSMLYQWLLLNNSTRTNNRMKQKGRKEKMIDIAKLKDKKITCQDCGITFTFETGEIAFYLSKGLAEPKRCRPCRQRRKHTLIIDTSKGVYNV
jgi:hypothetical protein